jgi:peptidoglycan/LPS O-acetylase OafA/YrhL
VIKPDDGDNPPSGPIPAPVEAGSMAPTPTPRQVSWDALRVVAIGAVLAYHPTFLAPLTLPGLDLPPWPLRMHFPFGASVLIVVSGYFAAMTVGRQLPLHWWARRLARLLPAFLVAVLLVFAVVRLFAPPDLPRPSSLDLIGNLALLHLLLPGIEFVDLAHWTVPVQVSAFTAIAILASAGRVRGRAATAVLWAVLVVPIVVRVTLMTQDAPDWLSAVMDGSGLNRAHLIVAGVTIYRWSKSAMGFPQLFALLCVVLYAHSEHPPDGDSVPPFAAALVLICVAAYRPIWQLPVLLALGRPLQWLAGISYGIYLVHYTIGTVLARRLADLGLGWWVWVPAFVLCAVLLGWILTVCVERPAFRLLTRRLPARSAA